MLQHLPLYVTFTFVGLTIWLFYFSLRVLKQSFGSASKVVALGVAGTVWLLLQAALAMNGVYSANPLALPPRLPLMGIAPALVLIGILFMTSKGRKHLDQLPLKSLTMLHSVRVLVEVVLYALSLYRWVPTRMTFEGLNYDIVAGLTAPLMVYCCWNKPLLGWKALLAWNCVSLVLLLNIVVNALLATPSVFQQFAFEQPNVAILHFPFVWLPTFIVPLVLFSHLVAIRKLMLYRTV